MSLEDGSGISEHTPLQPKTPRDIGSTVKLALLSGGGLIADGYDLGVVNVGLAIFGHLYAEEWHPRESGLVVSITLLGMIVGQLSFGVLADVFGRKRCAIATSLLMIIGACTTACAPEAGSPSRRFVERLVFGRLVLGLGIGGEFPLSAALAMEMQSRSFLTRTQMLAVNAVMMNLGVLLQYLVVLFLLSLPLSLEAVWRLAFAAGMIPAILALIFRLQMEAPLEHEQSPVSAVFADRAKGTQMLRALLAVSVCWFIFNFEAYSIGSFNALIFDQWFGKEKDSPRTMVHKNAMFGLSSIMSALCGSVFALLIESTLSRRSLQTFIFGAMVVLMMLCAEACELPATRRFDVMTYTVFCMVFFGNAALGLVTYIIPGESFPASVRGTLVGIASASGKLGAAVGTSIFPSLESAVGLKAVLQMNAAMMLLGVFVAANFTPERGEVGERAAKGL